jgi:hypothetical protein
VAVNAAAPAPFRPGAVAPSEAPVPFRPGAATASVAPEALVRHTRWGKTATTFGPTGRVVATLLLLIPLVVMGVGGLADPFVWGGAGLYLAVVVPWALRDIWKAGIVRVG